MGVPPFLLVTAVMFPMCFLTGVAKDTEPSSRGEREKGRRRYLGFEGDLVTSKHHSFLSSKPGLLVIDGYEYFWSIWTCSGKANDIGVPKRFVPGRIAM